MVVVTTDYMSLLFSKDTLLGCCFSCSKLFRKHTFELAVYAGILVTIYLYSIYYIVYAVPSTKAHYTSTTTG